MLAYLSDLLYALNMEFPKELRYTFETIQHIFMEMFTDCSQRVRSFKAKLLSHFHFHLKLFSFCLLGPTLTGKFSMMRFFVLFCFLHRPHLFSIGYPRHIHGNVHKFFEFLNVLKEKFLKFNEAFTLGMK